MLMYKIKAGNEVFVCRKLYECPMLEKVIQKPEEYEVTELYCDRNGRVQIKRPIQSKYIQKIYQFLENYRTVIADERKPFEVELEYEQWLGLEGKYVVTCPHDVYTIVAKFACMIPRGTDKTKRCYYTRLEASQKRRKTVGLTMNSLASTGIVWGEKKPLCQLTFDQMQCMDYLPEKARTEQVVLTYLDTAFPQWRQKCYGKLNVVSTLSDKDRDPGPTIVDKEYFIPYEIYFGDQIGNLRKLIGGLK